MKPIDFFRARAESERLERAPEAPRLDQLVIVRSAEIRLAIEAAKERKKRGR